MSVEAVIYKEALVAAQKATRDHIATNPSQWFPCGFAWVNITPARGKFVNYLKEQGVGRKSYEKGYDIWNPSGHGTQWMDAKYEGAKAFVDVLRKHGINAQALSRMD